MRKLTNWVGIVALAALLSACGGGGGGGQNTAPPADSSWLTFTPSPLTIVGKQGQSSSFSITATSSKTIAEKINLAIVDEDGVTNPQATTLIGLTDTTYRVTMQLKPTLAVGSKSGSFTLKICLDDPAVCSRPYPGSPWRVPYVLDVQPDGVFYKTVHSALFAKDDAGGDLEAWLR
ncbi:MAG: hypothetical protein EON54_27925, partial [Alcaligenaceae bacterium]